MNFRMNLIHGRWMAAVCLVLCGLGWQPAMANLPAGYTLSWSDEFSGTTLDTSKWFYRADAKHQSVQLPKNVSVADGHLVLTLKPEPAGIVAEGDTYYASGAGVISKQDFHYGYYETRAKLGDGVNDDSDAKTDEGWWHAYWAINAEEDPNRPGTVNTSFIKSRRTEIDAFENPSSDLSAYSQHVIPWTSKHEYFPNSGPNYTKLPADDYRRPWPNYNVGGWNTHGFLWTKDRVEFYVNGQHQQTAIYPDSNPDYIHDFVNIWLTAISHKIEDPHQELSQARYDYFRYYAPPKVSMPDGMHTFGRYHFTNGSEKNEATPITGAVSTAMVASYDPGSDMGFSTWGTAYIRASAAANSAAEAVAMGTPHFELTLDFTSSNRPVNLNELRFAFGGNDDQGDGFVSHLIIRSSATGELNLFEGSFNVPPGFGDRQSITLGSHVINLDNPAFAALTGKVRFTFHLWTNSDRIADVLRLDDVFITGSPTEIPEPTATALIALGCMLASRRSRQHH